MTGIVPALVAVPRAQEHAGRQNRSGSGVVRVQAILLTTALMLAPLTARAADFVVWWDKAFYPEEEKALAELVQDFGQKTGLTMELVRHDNWEVPKEIEKALAAGQPPDFMFALTFVQGQLERWTDEDRLVDLTDTIGNPGDFFDSDILNLSMLTNNRTGQRGLYGLPMGRVSTHIHVWLSLLEQAGFRREDIPTEWEPFWSFWCDQVQPAVRKALGRQDIWAVGATMSSEAGDTQRNLSQFVFAYTEAWPTPTGPRLLHDPAARAALVKGLEAYTAIYKKGCTPPDAVDWTNRDNNEAFLKQRVVMTINNTLSIPSALKASRPTDYYKNSITIGWPSDAFGRPERLDGSYYPAVVFKDGGHTAAALALVRFLVWDGGLARYLTSAGDRILPPSTKLLDQPFWLDPRDPHRLRAAAQARTEPHVWGTYGLDREQWVRLQHQGRSTFLSTAVHRVVVDDRTPEQAADEAIARVKQILNE
jgi:multiple sugar transport system substrate-binding protein